MTENKSAVKKNSFEEERVVFMNNLLNNILRETFKIKNYTEAINYYNKKIYEIELISGKRYYEMEYKQMSAIGNVYFGVFPHQIFHQDQENWVNNTPQSYEQGWADMINKYHEVNKTSTKKVEKKECIPFHYKEIPEYKEYLKQFM